MCGGDERPKIFLAEFQVLDAEDGIRGGEEGRKGGREIGREEGTLDDLVVLLFHTF